MLIFDCDGVLVDSEIISNSVDAELFAEIGIDISAASLIAEYSGRPKREIWADLAAKWQVNIPAGLMQRAYATIMARYPKELQAIAGASELIDRLMVPFAVASSSEMDKLRYSLELTDMLQQFEPNIFSATQVARGKPAPDLFLLAAQRMSFIPEQTLVIEDSRPGVEAALAAGMRVIGFTGAKHSYPNHEQILIRTGAERVFASMTEILKYLQELGWARSG